MQVNITESESYKSLTLCIQKVGCFGEMLDIEDGFELGLLGPIRWDYTVDGY